MSVAPFRWAENDTELWVTIEVQDAKDRVVTLAEDSFHFVCPSLNYDFTIPLFKKINVEESSFAVKDPGVELRLIKQDEGRWEKITTEQAKFKRWIKIDWDLFNDPDDEEDVVKNPGADFGQGGMDFSQLLGGMGGMEGMGGPGGMDFASMMGGMGGQGGPGGMDLASMMGGMGGQGGQGGMDFASMMAGMGGQGGEGGMPDMAAMQEMLASMQQQQGGHDHHHEHGEHCDHGHDHAQEQGQEQGEEAGDNTAAVVDEVE